MGMEEVVCAGGGGGGAKKVSKLHTVCIRGGCLSYF